MARLIDADALIKSFRKCYSGHLGMENSDSMMTFKSICRIINEQPTAYDVEKVVDDVRQDCYSMGFDESQTEIVVADIRKGGVE